MAVLIGMLVPVAARATGNWSAAGLLLALAVVADTFDGRFARRFARTDDQARVGVEIDSLSDALTFGLAPVMEPRRSMREVSSAMVWPSI